MTTSVEAADNQHILAHFKTEGGELVGAPIDLPLSTSVQQLQLICNALLQKEEDIPCAFFVDDVEVTDSLQSTLDGRPEIETEKVLEILYQPQAVFRVRAVTRCSSSIEGHAEAVISVAFSPDARHLASGSGDTTVRFWDINTETPHHTCKAHKNWVLCIAWSPDGRKLASADKNGAVCLWDPRTGKQTGTNLRGHRQWVTSLAWEPLHSNPECRKFASASKDTTVCVWDAVLGQCLQTLSSHTQSVTCVKWGGEGLIYTASQDRTVKVWRAADGVMCRTLEGHGHWVNTLALNTDFALRTGACDPAKATILGIDHDTGNAEKLASDARNRYDASKMASNNDEMLVSGSDDFTMFLWRPAKDKKPVARMTGHQQLINDVKFSPDGRLIASASFDKSVKIWNSTGKFLASLRGHVQAVYQVAWSADARLLCTASADSTIKVWDMTARKLLFDLPGHADEVYAVDWSTDGQKVVSGGKDKVLKIWRQ